jgi:hypothetical protein
MYYLMIRRVGLKRTTIKYSPVFFEIRTKNLLNTNQLLFRSLRHIQS